MRIPIAIVMLCLPMAAVGEAYVCTIEKLSQVYKEGSTTSTLGQESEPGENPWLCCFLSYSL